jgi:Protein of Unknown function (DUF2784).
MKLILADIILFIHFGIAIFFIFGLLIPLFYKFNWGLIHNYYFRLFHIILVIIVTIESLAGIVCPLTLLENILRNNINTDSFVSSLLKELLFWNYPIEFFILIYFICFCWTIFIWFYYPPRKEKKND